MRARLLQNILATGRVYPELAFELLHERDGSMDILPNLVS